jgi:hypothetical protein
MPQNAFSLALDNTTPVAIEPIQGTITTINFQNLGNNTIYLDVNNPLMTTTDGFPLVKDAVFQLIVTPSTTVYALGTASAGDVLKVIRNISPLSLL